jgi:hypothetical protein
MHISGQPQNYPVIIVLEPYQTVPAVPRALDLRKAARPEDGGRDRIDSYACLFLSFPEIDGVKIERRVKLYMKEKTADVFSKGNFIPKKESFLDDSLKNTGSASFSQKPETRPGSLPFSSKSHSGRAEKTPIG